MTSQTYRRTKFERQPAESQESDRQKARYGQASRRPSWQSEPKFQNQLAGFPNGTCRKAYRTLIKDGLLRARTEPRPMPAASCRTLNEERTADAAASLSAALAALRRDSGTHTAWSCALAGCSVTTVGHAGNRATLAVATSAESADRGSRGADGDLLRLHSTATLRQPP